MTEFSGATIAKALSGHRVGESSSEEATSGPFRHDSMTKLRHEPRVTELRIKLKAAGYSPIPLVGKIPPSAGWPTMADSEDAITTWPAKYPWAVNTGIKTRITPAIDVDITDVAVCRDVYSIAREFFTNGRVLARVGRFPKFAILLRSEAPFKKSKVVFRASNGYLHHIEILGDGQQLAAFGIHPDTKQPYRWDGGLEPGLVVPWQSLPLTNDDTNARFLRAIGDELKRKHGWDLKQNGASYRRTPQQRQELVSEGVDAGARNVALASLTGHLLRREVDPVVVLDLMLTWNQGRCRPPMSDEEVTAVVNSICGKELERRG
jgi:hypothetical protein